MDSQKGCERQTVKPLSSGVAKCAIVRMCFPTHLSSPGERGGAVFDGVTATPSCPFPLLGVEPASELGCLRNLHVEGVWVVPRHLWESRGVARASHGKSTCKSEVEFQPGCRYFPAFDVLFSHLYNR